MLWFYCSCVESVIFRVRLCSFCLHFLGINMLKNSFSSLVVSSNEAVEFKLGRFPNNGTLASIELFWFVLTLILFAVRQLADIADDSCTFKPVMSHQVFGER